MTITNLHQRKITEARLNEIREGLAALKANPPTDDNDAIGHRLAVAQAKSYVSELTEDIAAYDQLDGATQIPVDSFAAIGPALINARIAAGLTQAQLAERVGLQTSAINRYELANYTTAKLPRLQQIADAVGFNLTATLQRT